MRRVSGRLAVARGHNSRAFFKTSTWSDEGLESTMDRESRDEDCAFQDQDHLRKRPQACQDHQIIRPVGRRCDK
jgi:hypothetical protein